MFNREFLGNPPNAIREFIERKRPEPIVKSWRRYVNGNPTNEILIQLDDRSWKYSIGINAT